MSKKSGIELRCKTQKPELQELTLAADKYPHLTRNITFNRKEGFIALVTPKEAMDLLDEVK